MLLIIICPSVFNDPLRILLDSVLRPYLGKLDFNADANNKTPRYLLYRALALTQKNPKMLNNRNITHDLTFVKNKKRGSHFWLHSFITIDFSIIRGFKT